MEDEAYVQDNGCLRRQHACSFRIAFQRMGFQAAKREATIAVLVGSADRNDVSFIDSNIPHIVDRLYARGLSQDEIVGNISRVLTWPNEKERLAAVLALKLDHR